MRGLKSASITRSWMEETMSIKKILGIGCLLLGAIVS